MEDDKKKRKNKKKKNKQQHQQQQKPVAEDTSSNAGETSSQDHNHVEERSYTNQASGVVNGGLDDLVNSTVEEKGRRNDSNDTLGVVLADTEKQKWLQEEARLREMVKQLLYEKDSYLQREADLVSRIKQLQCENDSWHQKEASLEQKISCLIQEKADVSLEEVKLREKIRHIEKEKFLLVENENSSKELFAALNDENTRLKKQVLDLEGAQNRLSQENNQLLGNISTLESRIQDLEKSLTSAISPAEGQKDASEKEDLNAQIEAAFELVEKLVMENADLVEKLNELYMELERRKVVPEATSVEVFDDVAVTDLIPGPSKDFSSLSTSTKHFETVPIGNEQKVSDDMDLENANVVRHSSDATVSGEIVQIPLDENEVQDIEVQSFSQERDDEGVPITDAPLIGAPFRLISFVAKYVSGADLVNGNSSN
ncbi:uncharacterized protein LOC141647588 [Silene latifolia]|uniref:uncharacterized protein LOC141647588 n=1 Tax=Silene latifolia TaxID=37657 RepID=UPI003D76D746